MFASIVDLLLHELSVNDTHLSPQGTQKSVEPGNNLVLKPRPKYIGCFKVSGRGSCACHSIIQARLLFTAHRQVLPGRVNNLTNHLSRVNSIVFYQHP